MDPGVLFLSRGGGKGWVDPFPKEGVFAYHAVVKEAGSHEVQ